MLVILTSSRRWFSANPARTTSSIVFFNNVKVDGALSACWVSLRAFPEAPVVTLKAAGMKNPRRAFEMKFTEGVLLGSLDGSVLGMLLGSDEGWEEGEFDEDGELDDCDEGCPDELGSIDGWDVGQSDTDGFNEGSLLGRPDSEGRVEGWLLGLDDG